MDGPALRHSILVGTSRTSGPASGAAGRSRGQPVHPFLHVPVVKVLREDLLILLSRHRLLSALLVRLGESVTGVHQQRPASVLPLCHRGFEDSDGRIVVALSRHGLPHVCLLYTSPSPRD